MFGYVAAFGGGMIFLAGMYFIFRMLLNRAMRKLRTENQQLRRELARKKEEYAALEACRDQARARQQGREQGRAEGRSLRDAERFAENLAERNMQFRAQKKEGDAA